MKLHKSAYKPKYLEFRDLKECYYHNWDDHTFILKFGTKSRGSIKDSSGKNCILRVEYKKEYGQFFIYADYEGEKVCIYSDDPSIEIYKHLFPLKPLEINLMKLHVQDLIMENPEPVKVEKEEIEIERE